MFTHRFDLNLSQLISIVITKVHRKDYNKLAFLFNQYGHSAADQHRRSIISGGVDEATCQLKRKAEINRALQGLPCPPLLSTRSVHNDLCCLRRIYYSAPFVASDVHSSRCVDMTVLNSHCFTYFACCAFDACLCVFCSVQCKRVSQPGGSRH